MSHWGKPATTVASAPHTDRQRHDTWLAGVRRSSSSHGRCPSRAPPPYLSPVPASATLQARVERALSQLKNPRNGSDVLSTGMVKDLAVDGSGTVTLTFLLGREDPGSLARDVRKAVQGVEGVTAVHVSVADASRGSVGTAPRSGPGGVPPPPTPVDLPHLGRVLAISSGKGGVGKSTVSANLAVALARAGHRVGLMDADIYGPNIPRMMGVDRKPEVQGGKIQPLEAHGVKLMSLALIVERDAPAIWRGPIIMKVIQQFVKDVDWGELDYFLVDLPPGTGDAQLSLAQTVHIRAAIIVTTPQEVAVGDSLRGAKMFERVGVPVLGVVENMSYFVCPHCGERTEIFLAGGGTRLADELGVPLLGQIPLQAHMADLADAGRPIVAAEPSSPAAQALDAVARRVTDALAALPR
ncbi:MAG TPA: Mrp/NBP35 family ATP-binding protein [Gemmatimonadales bacterium]|nr:Mrp/NBP35 family ATP-binding protein [Gemmatimonadales bacterium]